MVQHRSLLFVLATLSASFATALASAGAAHATLIPAPTGGSAPTIAPSIEHGAPGDALTVAGAAPGDPGASRVRVQWLLADATEPAVEAPLDAGAGYLASLTVPPDAAPGPARICAGLLDLPFAELACVDFTIDEPPPGSVVGMLPGGSNAASASSVVGAGRRIASELATTSTFVGSVVGLANRAGQVVARTTPTANGAFTFASVPAGRYTVVQEGVAPALTAPISVTVRPGTTTTTAAAAALSRPAACPGTETAVLLNSVLLRPSAPAENATWGTYIHGVPLQVELYSASFAQTRVEGRAGAFPVPQEIRPVGAMRYDVFAPNGQLLHTLQGDAPDYVAAFDVGSLPVGVSRVVASPVVDGVACTPAGGVFQRTIRVVGNPDGELARADSTIDWVPGGANGHYRFRLTLPNIPALPLAFPDKPLGVPLPIPLDQNHFDAGVTVGGTIALDGTVTFTGSARSFFDFTLLGKPILQESAEISVPPGLSININNPATLGVPFAVPSILPIKQEFLIYQGTVFDLFGLVQVYASMSAGFDGDVGIDGFVQPLLPNARVRVTPRVAARGSAALGLGALNVVTGGGRMRTRFGLAVPFVATLDPLFAGPEGPCLFLQADAEFFVRVTIGPITLHELTSPSYPIVLPIGAPLYFPAPFCTLEGDAGAARPASVADATDEEAPPPFGTLDPAPAVAASLEGDVMRVRVADRTSGTGEVTSVLLSELRDPITGDWGPASALTDGTHWVGDPALAWWGTGADKTAVAVWTERPMSLDQDLAFISDLPTLMNRHELFLATWNGVAWSAPLRLTDDLVADGSATIAGDAGGFSLAWVRDTDGDLHTHDDLRIAALDAPDGIPGAMRVLEPSDDGLNTQPSIARDDGRGTIVWTIDEDADLTTDADRHLMLARCDDDEWYIDDLAGFPPAADSPSLTFVDGLEQIAFLVRGLDDDGVTPVGALGVRARVHVATNTNLHGWRIAPVLESAATGVVARGESPTVVAGPGDEMLVVYRRFGSTEPADTWGQLMLAKLRPDATTTEPMALTRGTRQRWFPSVALDPSSGEVIVVALDLPGETPSPDDYAVVTRVVAPGGDPALERLKRDAAFAAPGSTVPVRVTLRNAGRAPIPLGQLSVAFYAGTPDDGTLVATVPATSGGVGSMLALEPNQTVVVAADFVAAPGVQPIFARVLTTGDDADPSNDVVTAELRALSPPRHVNVNPASGVGGALDVTWVAPPELQVDAVAVESPAPVVGYRIERSDVAGGARELAGEATGTGFRDALLQPGTTACYVVVAYDASGVLSAPSAETCGSVPADAPRAGRGLAGTSLQVVANPARPAANALSVVSNDTAVGLGAVNGSVADPVLHGAALQVGSASGDTFDGIYDLPARNWSYIGGPGRNLGYRYRDKSRTSPAGPVTSIVVKPGKTVRITARGATLAVGLTGLPDPVDVVLALGEQSLCMRFGGDVTHVIGRRFRARRAPAPRHCPLLPGAP